GNIWFTEPGAIGIFNPTSHAVTEVHLPSATQIPTAIMTGPDGNIWFTESVPQGGSFASSAVGIINSTTDSYVTEIALPATSQPSGITRGSDQDIWVTEKGAGAIAQIQVLNNPTQDSLLRTLSIPTNVVTHPAPIGITSMSNGTLAFADSGGAIGVVDL